MILHTLNRRILKRGHKGHATVSTDLTDHILVHRAVVAVGEVTVGQWASSPAPRAILASIPSHVRNARLGGEPAHQTRQQAQTLHPWSFLAALKQRLHPQADPEEWHALRNLFEQRLAQAQHVERVHHLSEMPDTRQDEVRCGPHARWRVDDGVLYVDFCEGIADTRQVSGAVIDDRNHKSHLVDGN